MFSAAQWSQQPCAAGAGGAKGRESPGRAAVGSEGDRQSADLTPQASHQEAAEFCKDKWLQGAPRWNEWNAAGCAAPVEEAGSEGCSGHRPAESRAGCAVWPVHRVAPLTGQACARGTALCRPGSTSQSLRSALRRGPRKARIPRPGTERSAPPPPPSL